MAHNSGGTSQKKTLTIRNRMILQMLIPAIPALLFAGLFSWWMVNDIMDQADQMLEVRPAHIEEYLSGNPRHEVGGYHSPERG